MGLAIGVCLVSGASAVLMVSVPEPDDELDSTQETSAEGPAGEGDPDGTRRHPAASPSQAEGADTASGSSPDPDASPSEEETPVLLRSVEDEVDTADGDIQVMKGEGEVMGEGSLTTFAVEVEKGLPGDDEDFVEAVELILGDPRSWGEEGDRSLQRVDGDDADIRVLLAAPDTVDRMCAPLNTNGFVSCANGNRAIINQNRWVAGVEDFEDDLETYRIYVINHEVGHTLGHGHVDCPGEGEVAPVMQQQTLGLQGCEANGWVDPDAD